MNPSASEGILGACNDITQIYLTFRFTNARILYEMAYRRGGKGSVYYKISFSQETGEDIIVLDDQERSK